MVGVVKGRTQAMVGVVKGAHAGNGCVLKTEGLNEREYLRPDEIIALAANVIFFHFRY